MQSTAGTIETPRLILRPWKASDARALYVATCDPEIGSKAGWAPHRSVEDCRQVIADALMAPENYALTIKGTARSMRPVGSIELTLGGGDDLDIGADEAELTFWIAKPFWGNGYMPEAIIALLRHAFLDLELSAVWCGYFEGNAQGARVQEKTGFIFQYTIADAPRPFYNDTASKHFTRLTRDQWQRGQGNDPIDSTSVANQLDEAADLIERIPLVAQIRSGGQTGADRGSLDAAREAGIPICGWCPANGLAEDSTPGNTLLEMYPELIPTPSTGYVQRTAWNVRDSHATLIVAPDGLEPGSGTEMTKRFAEAYGRPCLVVAGPEDLDDIIPWLEREGKGLVLNVAGPRESKLPGVYEITKAVIAALLGGELG